MRSSRLQLGIVGGIILLAVILGIIVPILIFPPEITPIEVTFVTRTPTPTPILVPATATPSVAPTGQPASPTPTVTPTPEPTETPKPTVMPTMTPTPTLVVTATPTVAPSPTPIPAPTLTPASPPVPLPPHPAADVVVNLADPKQLLATFPNQGIYRSNDGGYTWRKTWPVPGSNLGPGGLRGISLIPTTGPIVYAATFNGVLWSLDGGDTWNESIGAFGEGHLPREAQVYTVAAPKNIPETVYAGTQVGLFVGKFEDNGLTWNVARVRLPGGDVKVIDGVIYTIAVDPDDGRRVFAAGKGDEIYRSGDGGASWEVRICEPCGSNVFALAAGQRKLYAAGGQKEGQPTLAISQDRGDTWILANDGIPTRDVPTLVVSALAIDPANPEVLYAGTGAMVNDNSHGVYRSLDGGGSWGVINDGLPMTGGGKNYYVQGIAVDKVGGVYIAGFGGIHKLEGGRWRDEWRP